MLRRLEIAKVLRMGYAPLVSIHPAYSGTLDQRSLAMTLDNQIILV
jgi:hypothetical protein